MTPQILAASAKPQFQTWKIIKIGTHKSVKGLLETLANKGFLIGNWAADILLRRTTLTATAMEIEIVKVSVGELGFEKGATRTQIYARAAEYGLELVPAEVGPQLRLQYPDQPFGEYVFIGMELLTGTDVFYDVFYVAHLRGEMWLNTAVVASDDICPADKRWVFTRRK